MLLHVLCIYSYIFAFISIIWIICTNSIAVFCSMTLFSADQTMVLDQLVQPGSTMTWTSWGLGHLTVLSRCDEVERSWKILTSVFFSRLLLHVTMFLPWFMILIYSSIVLNWHAVWSSITFPMLHMILTLFMVFFCEWFWFNHFHLCSMMQWF